MKKTDNKDKVLKTIIYCRVSTKEQVEEGLSLQNQEKACIDYAEKKGFIKDKIFIEEGESAKTQLRTQLLALLDYCKENTGKIDALIVWKLDRFSRQTSDHFALKALLAKYGVRIYSVTEPIDETPQGQLMETVLAGFAQFDNDIRSERSTIGMRDRINEGRWVWKAPIGYLNSKDAFSNPILV
ncbi:MAG: recombinase family protein, partial [Candidatus Bathyarchaeia archaeon]